MQHKVERALDDQENPSDGRLHLKVLDLALVEQVDGAHTEWESWEPKEVLDPVIDVLADDWSEHDGHRDARRDEEDEGDDHGDELRISEEVLKEHGHAEHAHTEEP